MPISPKQHAEFLRRLAREQIPDVARALLGVAREGAKLARARTREIHKVDTGHFADGWGAGMREEGPAIENTAIDAPWAEMGRRPGAMPPLVVLVRWVERRLGLGGHKAWAAARAIAHKIAQRGTKGAQVLDWLRPRLVMLGQKAVIKELENGWTLRQ